jgi:hypothetical protein
MGKSREVLGHIIKEEQISLLSTHLIKGTEVINIDHPFPGVHGVEFNFSSKPRSIILTTRSLYSLAKILRAQKIINKDEKFNINASFAKVKIGKQLHYGIRVKGLSSYDDIPELQQKFIDNQFEFLYKSKIKTDKAVSIKISKFFHIEQMDKGVYKDTFNKDIYYVSVPDYINWETFRKLTSYVKNNVSNNNFDVVKGIFYMDDCVNDIIRIYKPNMSLELLNEIKDRYCKAFKLY